MTATPAAQQWFCGARHAVRAVCPQKVLNWRERRYYARYGEVELHVVRHLCRRDEDAIDIGANDGSYIHFLRLYARCVYAFEPLPRLVQALKTKFRADIDRGTVVIESVALSNARGAAVLRVPVVDGVLVEGCSSVTPAVAVKYPVSKEISVRTRCLDDVYFRQAGYIKIDVEGHEEDVLAGARRTIIRCQPRVQVELEESIAPGAVGRVAEWFRGLGYSGYFVYRRRLTPIGQFRSALMQRAADYPDLTAGLDERERFGPFIYNFLFFPRNEPQQTLRQIGAHLARL